MINIGVWAIVKIRPIMGLKLYKEISGIDNDKLKSDL